MPGRESFETFNGCKIRLMRGGAGAPMVYLHGARGAPIWLPFMERLAQHFELIVPEHPGFGGSETPPWLDNVGDVAYFYLDVLAALKLKAVHLVGTSLGGWIAAELAVRNTARLASLVLSGPAGIHVKGLSKGDIFLWSNEEHTRNLFYDQKIADQALARTPSEDELMLDAKNKLTLAKLAWQPRLYNPDLHKWLHRIDVPTLLLWGDKDKVVPPGYGPEFQKLIPGARLEIIKDCGHLPHVERADEFVDRIVAFAEEKSR